MGNNNTIVYGIIGLLVIVVIGLAVDRSNQITSLTEQATLAAQQAQEASDSLAATIEANDTAAQESAAALEALATQVAVSSTEFESQISVLSGEAEELTGSNLELSTANEDLSTQVAGLQTDLDEANAIAETQSAIAATSEADAIEQASLLEAEIARANALETQIADMIPTATPSPEPTPEPDLSVPDTSELEFVFQVDVDNREVARFSPDSESIAVLRSDNVIQTFSTVDGTPQLELADFDAELSEFIYASNGRSIAAVADNSSVIVFDSATGSVSFEQDLGAPVTGYDLSPDNNAIILGNARSIEISVFEPSRNQTRQGGVLSLDWSDDNTQVVTASGSTVTVFDIDNYLISGTSELDTAGAQVVHVAFSPDGTHIAGVTVDAEFILWSVESGDIAWQTSVDAGDITGLAWSSDSAHIALVAEGDIRIYSASGSWIAHAELDGVTSVDWSADGALLGFVSADQVSVIEASTLLN